MAVTLEEQTLVATTSEKSYFGKCREVVDTCNLGEASGEHNFLSKWLLITRACVFSMTLVAGLIGGLLAVGAENANWWLFAVAIVGVVFAHAANNMMIRFVNK